MDSPSQLIRKMLTNTLHEIRVIGGTKSSRPRRELKDKPRGTENRFENRVESGKAVPNESLQIKVEANDAKVKAEMFVLISFHQIITFKTPFLAASSYRTFSKN